MGCSHLCPKPSSRHCAADIGCISLPSTSAERKNTSGKVAIKLRVPRPRWLNLNAVSNPINTSANESLTGHSFGAKRELVCNFRSRRHLWHLERLDKESGQETFSQRQRAFRKLCKQTLLFVKIINNNYYLITMVPVPSVCFLLGFLFWVSMFLWYTYFNDLISFLFPFFFFFGGGATFWGGGEGVFCYLFWVFNLI